MAVNNWPSVLRNAGIGVKVHPEVGWLSNGALRDCNIVWHHDASPAGDSPGALSWMKQNYSVASAQIWVDRYGTWHFISYGVAWHAGRVNDQRFDNYRSVGIETDHTTGEEWPAAQLESLRSGTAAVLKYEGKSAQSLAFHKTICVPAGRKSDPDGLTLATERAIVQQRIATPTIAAVEPETIEEEDEPMITVISPKDIPAGAQAYPVGHDGNKLWGISDPGAWGEAAKFITVPYADWVAVVQAYGNPIGVEIKQ